MNHNLLDNYIEQLEDVIDFTKTAFLVITKSGSTAETISSFMYMLGIMKGKYDLNPGNHFFFITDPKKGKLRELAFEWQVKALSIPPEVGGRFSVLTPVGLLPAAILGIDIEEILDGAAKMDNASFKEDVLRVTGEKKYTKDEEKKNYHHNERRYGTFERGFKIHSDVIEDKIEANFNNGVLTVELPKAEVAKPKEIEVKVK